MGTQLKFCPSVVTELSNGHLQSGRDRQTDRQKDKWCQFKSNFMKLNCILLDSWCFKLALKDKSSHTHIGHSTTETCAGLFLLPSKNEAKLCHYVSVMKQNAKCVCFQSKTTNTYLIINNNFCISSEQRTTLSTDAAFVRWMKRNWVCLKSE